MSDGKKSLIYTARILERTDAANPITAGAICDILENEYGIITERRTVGRHIKTLIDTGMKIKYCRDNRKGCYLAERLFDEAELKFLLDSADKTTILGAEESDALKTKILSLASSNMKRVLSNVAKDKVTSDRTAEDKEHSVLEIMKLIISAMQSGRRLCFMYGDRDRKLKLVPRRNGAVYTVDPYALTQNDGRYYLVCRYEDKDSLSYYRLDKMIHPQISDKAVTAPKEIFGEAWREQIADFIDGTVRNYGGSNKIIITLRADASMIGYMHDEFGSSIIRTEEAAIKGSDENNAGNQLDIYINTAENDGLYYLLLQYGSNIEVMAPAGVRERYKKILREMLDKYK